MFGDTKIYDAQRQVTLKLETVIRNLFKHSRYYANSGYLQGIKLGEETW